MTETLIYTFYSYKGGVGRSMALANIAELFYQAGFRVLAVDWDLEAPGLDRFLVDDYEQAQRHLGLMDMLKDYKRAMAKTPNPQEKDNRGPSFSSIEPYYIDIRPVARDGGSGLMLMTSGARDGDHFREYAQSVLAFDWRDFYEKWEGEIFFEWLRREFLKIADVVLIDSRTGVTEMGGVCTYQLADVVVMFCTATEQSMAGTYEMAMNLKKPELTAYRQGRKLEIMVVPSRIDKGDSTLVDEFQKEFLRVFKDFVTPRLGDDPRQFWNLNIPYVPKYAFRERVAVRESTLASAEDIVLAFVGLTKALIALNPDNVFQKRLSDGLDEALRHGIRVRPQIKRSISLATSGASPYRGLQFFDVNDADIFFGREQLTDVLIAHLRQQRFLAVVGASGSGKSSLVRAGLVPALTKGKALADSTLPPAGGERWSVHIITPTAYPLTSLATSLIRDSKSVTAVTTLMDDLAKDSQSLRIYVRRLLEGRADRLLLVVDQFEELFTLCRDKSERKAFIDNLLTAAEADGQTVVVLTLRADFYAQCAEFDNLREALARQQKYIGPMSQDELRRAIEEPARFGDWTFEPGLVDLMLRDVGDEPGALPLLSHALLETWKRRQGRTLTLAGYAESGGVQGAIATTAEQVYNRLMLEQQRIARNIFLRLTELGEGSQDTRRRVALNELIPNPEDKPEVEAVLRTLVDARLVTAFQDATEVAHEALIREWPRLQEWLAEDREGLRLHRRLTEATQEWVQLGRDPPVLFRGMRLTQIAEWAGAHDDALNDLEREFVHYSHLQANSDAARLRKRARFTFTLATLVILGFFPSLFVGANAWMYFQRQRSNWQPIAGFPSHVVTMAAIASEARNDIGPLICIGTDHIGVGCSNDGMSWNIYENGLPLGSPDGFNSREMFWGALVGEQWSGRIRSVTAIAFDSQNSLRVFAFLQQRGLYHSMDGGVHWKEVLPKSTLAEFPQAGASKIDVYDDYIFVGSGTQVAGLTGNQKGHLFVGTQRDWSWQKKIDSPATGMIEDFWVSHSKKELFELFFVSERGLFGSRQTENWLPAKLTDRPDRGNLIAVTRDINSSIFYLIGYDSEKNWSNLYRWYAGDTNLTLWGEGHAGAIRAVAVNPGEQVKGDLWVLFENGHVFSIDESGGFIERGARPGWPWSQTNTIWFALDPESTTGQYIPYLGQADGILKCLNCLN